MSGGGIWLFLEAREEQTRLATDRLRAVVESLVQRLQSEPGISIGGSGSAPEARWRELFVALPALREVSLRDRDQGLRMCRGADGDIERLAVDSSDDSVATRPPEIGPQPLAAQPLHGDSGAIFTLGFDLATPGGQPSRLVLGFDRADLLSPVHATLRPLRHAMLILGLGGSLCILIAFGSRPMPRA